MARSARDKRLETRGARLSSKNVAIGKRHFLKIGKRVALVYRRGGQGSGTWSVKHFTPEGYALKAIGQADDYQDANGVDVLDFYQAQDKAKAYIAAAQAPASPLTVAQAADRYLEFIAAENGKSAERDARAKLNRHVIPRLGKKQVAALTFSELRSWLNSLVKRDPEDEDCERRSKDTANRVLATLKAALNFAFKDDANHIPSDNAWRKVTAFKKVGRARENHFTESEAATLIDAARKTNPRFADLLEAAFYTGARAPGELAALNVRHFDAATNQLRIVDGKTGPRIATLTAEAVEFFKRITKDRKPDDVLLPKADGSRWGKSDQHRPMKAALKAAELPASASLYTMRHTYISRAIERGMPLLLIAENVGNSVRMIEANYAHILSKVRKELIERHAPSLRVVQPIEKGKAA